MRRTRALADASWYWLLQSSRGAKRAAKLPVLLKQEVDGLGAAGERVAVNQGFAHNWLFPRRLAGYDPAAGHGGRKPKGTRLADRKAADAGRAGASAAREASQLAQIMQRLLEAPLEVKRKFRRGEILEGQVTKGSIVDAIAKQRRIDISPELLDLPAPIITHGTFDVPLAVLTPAGERAVLKVVVAR